MSNYEKTIFRFHPLFWVIAGIAVFTGFFYDLLLLFLIVLTHEMGHAAAAFHFKWRVKKIELLPFGGVMETSENGSRPLHEEVMVAVAGPFMHIPLILLSFFLVSFHFWQPADHTMFLHYNLVLLCFNLLPIWPLDGGKLLQAFLSSRLSFYHAQKVMWKMSCFFLCTGAALFFYLFPYHLQAWMLFLFFIIVHYTEWKQQPYRFFRFLLEREKKAHPSPHTLPEEEKIISFSESPWDVAKKIRSNRYHQFLMKENGQTVPESYILEAIISEGTGRTPVKEQLSFFKK
ncbi:M50 family metallopeptidase [Alteribacillus iranensis]|uniref:Stage IV sporulation protein FB n=1 Tax=Alteribacillus iranensis TaxID=930128 RepID=A0A1I2CT45_9BACI|nr:M50 family metallopeptidase [Alteribacillus iranensis]SFE70910.1 stage IV sporulation protein FB [Alteribacillus iranensis]